MLIINGLNISKSDKKTLCENKYKYFIIADEIGQDAASIKQIDCNVWVLFLCFRNIVKPRALAHKNNEKLLDLAKLTFL